VLCAADEVAVDLFLSEQIKFTEIPNLIEKVLAKHQSIASPTLEETMTADGWARQEVLAISGAKSC
jgi:1-deoxy-D-xylulose-5-phosphate reductoisomerase